MQEELKKPITRAAIYARSATYNPTSIARQLELCRAAAADHSWQIDDRIFSDNGKPGSTMRDREGLRSLLQMAAEQPRPFDYVLVESSGRLARSMTITFEILETLASHGIGVYLAAQRLDSRDTNFGVMVEIFATVEDQFIRALREKALKSSHKRVRLGYTSGGRYFGYESYRVEIPDTGDIKNCETRAKLRIVVEEAKTIRRIYRLFADGASMQEIARRLTNEGVPGPGKDAAPLWNARLVNRPSAAQALYGISRMEPDRTSPSPRYWQDHEVPEARERNRSSVRARTPHR
jgi:site-specific DNA recombinase